MNPGRFGRVGRVGRVGWAGRLILAVVLAALLASAGGRPAPASALSCQVRQHRTGRVCWCWIGNRWVSSPMVMCRLSR